MEETIIYPTEEATNKHMTQVFGLMLEYEFNVEYSPLDGTFTIKAYGDTQQHQVNSLLDQIAMFELPFTQEETRI